MPDVMKFLGTLTIGAVLSGGVVALGAATTTSGAEAATAMVTPYGGDWREYPRNRSWNRNHARARNWNRSLARSWAWARHFNRSHSRTHSSNRQAQSVNIRLVFPGGVGTPVTATATSNPRS